MKYFLYRFGTQLYAHGFATGIAVLTTVMREAPIGEQS
jgi:hypothetical protein